MKRGSKFCTVRGLTAGISLMAVSVSASAVELNLSSGTKAKLYGFAELNMMYDVNADLGPLLIPQRIGLNSDGPEGHFQADANQSRLGFSTVTELEDGSELKTVLEGDFFGGGPDGGELRLRHAYGEWKGILAGQTWTNFPGFTGIYPAVEFRAPVGTSNTRQAQLRYTVGKLSLALEEAGNLGGEVVDTATSVAADAKNSMPDFTVQYATRGATSYHVAGLMRQLSVDSGADDDSALGWGVAFGIAQDITDALTLRASVVHGDGVGGYLNINPGAPAYVVNGDVETIEATGGTLAATLKMGPGAITLGTAIATADWDDAVKDGLTGAAGANEEFRSTHLNYIWSPVKKITFGVEAGYHERETWNGERGNALRLQGMAQYAF